MPRIAQQHEKAPQDEGISHSAVHGRQRVIIEAVEPELDNGGFPIKRTVGEAVIVEASVFTDGHDAIDCRLLFRPVDRSSPSRPQRGGRAAEWPPASAPAEGEGRWRETAMKPIGNDRWRGRFLVEQLGEYEYSLVAWIDHFESWRRDLKKKFDAGQDVSTDLEIGAGLIEETIDPVDTSHGEPRDIRADDRAWLEQRTAELRDRAIDIAERVSLGLETELAERMRRSSPRRFATIYGKLLRVVVDPKRAKFSTWYEVFPRSCSSEPGRHGSFNDLVQRLPYIAELGFDVLYLPPIHPIGRTKRKGKNNSRDPQPDDVGSPWAIGAEEGGHKWIHPELGTDADFRHLVRAAEDHGLQVALDIAFQCSPDHPYVKQHPEWFRHRPDGSIQYAENPPKKYEDIYPFDFETDAWPSLWKELKSIFEHWIDRGVRIFRVDNPHTKAFPFWQWCIDDLKREHPDLILLSEAFTRPAVMKRLARLGFTLSYTYFAWKNTKDELEEYLTELTKTSMREYFRPNLWPNTPDILNEYLQHGGRGAFLARLALAATLAASYGIYGPAYELCEHMPREHGSEEYLDSEKYQIRHWNLDAPDSIAPYIARINRIRRDNPALHGNESLHFHETDNDLLIAYSKNTDDLDNILLTVVNLDPHHVQSGWIGVDIDRFELDEDSTYHVHDLITDAHYVWHGRRNYVELNPHATPAHIMRLKRRVRTEQDFEYFL